MQSKFVSSTLSKTQLMTFLGLAPTTKIAKKLLVARLLQLIATDPDEMTRLLETFPYELAVGPTEVEELLCCTQVERKRWIREGKLPVLECRRFRKAGRDLEYPVHDRRVLLAISQEDISCWREAHQKQVQMRRKAGAQAAVEQRKINQQKRHDFQASWQHLVGVWQQRAAPELVAVLVLAYWTVMSSRWAKENQVKSSRGIKYSAVYAAQRDAWYERKNQAMRLLVQTPYARLSFYRPPEPDKHYLWLCEEHYEIKCGGDYENIWDFFYHHAATIKKCPQCIVSNEKDYYSLYHLEVVTETFPDIHFSFHMPYHIGKDWFPAPVQLPKVEHIEQDGIFRFGRSLLASEKITHREQDVLAHFVQAFMEAKKFYSQTISNQ